MPNTQTPDRKVTVRVETKIEVPATRYTDATHTTGPWQLACQAQGLTGVVEVHDVRWVGADRLITEMLDVEPGERVVAREARMSTLRDGPIRVVQLQTTWFPEWVAADNELSRPGRLVGGVYNALIAAGHRPVDAHEVVSARPSTELEAVIFDSPVGSPVLESHRVAWDRDGHAVVFTDAILDALHASLTYPQAL